uniref:hypothetical protein n=1 Tax=Azospirillum argentinense TaxID=2970906 RepID=UPI001586E480|nr:hypothetical protein [Azospirillum argentinense]
MTGRSFLRLVLWRWITALPACADFLDDIFAPTAKRASAAGIGAADERQTL